MKVYLLRSTERNRKWNSRRRRKRIFKELKFKPRRKIMKVYLLRSTERNIVEVFDDGILAEDYAIEKNQKALDLGYEKEFYVEEYNVLNKGEK